MKNSSQNSNFLKKRLLSFYYAIKGIGYVIKTQPNAWIHLGLSILVIFFGLLLNISTLEWILISFAIGQVLAAEAFNTALEVLIDWISPEYHPQAGIVKDVVAGAVLLLAISSAMIGLIIFLPKLNKLFSLLGFLS